MSDQWCNLLSTVRLSFAGNRPAAFSHAQLLAQVMHPALEATTDPQPSLVFLRPPISHAPNFHDGTHRCVSLNLNREAG